VDKQVTVFLKLRSTFMYRTHQPNKECSQVVNLRWAFCISLNKEIYLRRVLCFVKIPLTLSSISYVSIFCSFKRCSSFNLSTSLDKSAILKYKKHQGLRIAPQFLQYTRHSFLLLKTIQGIQSFNPWLRRTWNISFTLNNVIFVHVNWFNECSSAPAHITVRMPRPSAPARIAM
jgi:hypothetical protein